MKSLIKSTFKMNKKSQLQIKIKLNYIKNVFLVGLVFVVSIDTSFSQDVINKLPMRGFAIAAPNPNEVDDFVDFVQNNLSKTPVNTIFLRINYRFKFNNYPELAEKDGLSKIEVRKIVNACNENSIKVIPIMNLLGHQSWKQDNISSLLRVYPQFEEIPTDDQLNSEDFYCRSYCPKHPGVHEVVFALLDEMIDVFETDAIHVGMDEVFVLGSDSCPRCKGKNKAKLFAGEVTKIHGYLKSKNVKMYMWGDRLIDGKTTGLGKWSASENGTHTAIDMIPKDVIICDWQYRTATPTPFYFAIKGFDVISCSFQFPHVAEQQLQAVINNKKYSSEIMKERTLGVMHTYWASFNSFYKCYNNEDCNTEKIKNSIKTFKALYH